MWTELICGVALYRVVKYFLSEDDAPPDFDSSHSDTLFAVARRLEKLYTGCKVYVGLQIPDPDTVSRQSIDLLVVTNKEAMVISVKNVAGFVSIDKGGSWVCTDKENRTECFPNPVAETKELVSILEEYLEQRGIALPEGYLSFKVLFPNPDFRSNHSQSFPPEVITYNQWMEMQESFSGKFNSVLSTVPIWDRLELEDKKYIVGEFLEFKGKQEDLQALRNIKRSKVGRLIIRKISTLGFAHSTVQILYASRDYRVEGPTKWEKITVGSSTEVVFQPQNSEKSGKYKLSSVVSMSLSV